MDYKKGMSLGDAASMAIAFVVFVVVLGVGASTLSGVQSGQTAGTVAYNATSSGLTGIKNLADQSGTIGTVLGAAVLLGIIVGAFYFAKKE